MSAHSQSIPLRLIPTLAGAVLITLAVFLFMQRLIIQSQRQPVEVVVYDSIQIVEPPEEENEPEPEPQERSEEAPREPSLQALDIPAPSPALAAAPSLQAPDLAIAINAGEFQGSGESWSAPLSADSFTPGTGKDAAGYVQVTPFDTRRPNVPELAWQNKINGWVLVAFNLSPEGRTANIRVLDANPRGVFEEKVISAVQDWRYSVSLKGRYKGDIVLTQRVEIFWKNYPYNLRNVD